MLYYACSDSFSLFLSILHLFVCIFSVILAHPDALFFTYVYFAVMKYGALLLILHLHIGSGAKACCAVRCMSKITLIRTAPFSYSNMVDEATQVLAIQPSSQRPAHVLGIFQ